MSGPVRLREFNNDWYHPGRSVLVRALWLLIGQPIFRSSLLPSSALRVLLLRCFGGTIGKRVVIHSEVVVKYPWHLFIGDDCWIGERVWIDCLTRVQIASNVCVSQGAYLCTGNHDWRDPAFGLRTEPIHLFDGAWIGARSILLPGATLDTGAIVTAGSVLAGTVPPLQIFGGNPARYLRDRVLRESVGPEPVREAAIQ